ncbi:MAG: ATP synthase F1 subunit delta, partial [Ectothiorhodospiraceae bacterium]|nr:ATP synthase F1 subunit delta [Ectothiorhodospiraceae bacterium]
RVIADGRFGDMMTRALVLLAQKGREGYIHEIILALLELRNQQKGIQPLDVSTAVELSGDLKQRLSDGMQDFTKKNVDVNYSVDPALLGGVVIRIKDTVYDGSIARQLSRLRDSFAKGTAANG